MNKHFNKHIAIRIFIKLYRFYIDLSGIQKLLENENRYFIIVIDDTIRSIWIKYIKDKFVNTIISILINLINQIEREFNFKIVIIRIDNSRGEFGL